TNGLDHQARSKFFNTLTGLKKELGLTVIVVSHDIIFISTYVDELIYIDGKVIIRGKPEDVVSSPFTRLAYGYRETASQSPQFGGKRRLPYV
ncbi:MAG TPA: hypothetical protein VFD15_04045, partial [Clostridia bacterium]|nr:hypothetical protein [Clostridia bacterium]